MPRNDAQFIENAAIAFAMYCDDNELSVDEGRALAEDVAAELDYAAGDRESAQDAANGDE